MLLITKIYKYSFLALALSLFISGCTSKVSTRSYEYNNKKYVEHVKVKDSKIRNSKAMHRATMRSYVIAGKRYYPTLAKVGDTLHGIASWYGPNFHAKKTSNGEVYNMYALTAAHKTLPMNTIVKVLNLENGKSIIVRINDRGPFVTGRIIDLSNKAAHAIDMVKKGTAKVQVDILGFNARIARTHEEKQEVASVSSYYVQVGAFSRHEGALVTKRKFKLILENRYDVIIKKASLFKDNLNRVWISGFKSLDEANDFKEKNGLNTSMIIAQ